MNIENVKGLVNLTLVTAPVLKTMRTQNGGTAEYWDLTLSDGRVIYNRVTGDSKYDFTQLEVGIEYTFAIMTRVKNVTAVANNGNQYNKAYNDFKIMGTFEKMDLSKIPELKILK